MTMTSQVALAYENAIPWNITVRPSRGWLSNSFPMASMTRLAKECRKSSRQLLRRLCLSEIKLAHTDDEVRQEMATVGAAGICHFLPSAQARPGGDGASQVSLIRLISDCLSGQE